MAEPTKDSPQTGAIQSHSPPRRGSFQDDVVMFSTTRQDHTASSTDSRLTPDDEAGQTIEVINADAVGSNGKQSAISQPADPDDDAMLTDDDPGFTKSSSASRRQSNTPSSSVPNPAHPQQSPSSEDSAIELGQNAYQLPSDPNAKTGKLRNKYVMPDGTVVNGKGLGRGRPGIKRGPRKSALSNEITGTPDNDSIILFTPSPAPQSRSVAVKRKRADSYPSEAKDDEDDFSLSSRESTPEYNPAASTQTRSGRQVQKPVPTVTPSSGTNKPATKRPSLPQMVSSPSIKKHPKIKAKVYRGREQFALCEHCLRGNGPPGNVIVFCDACNKCWHQRCHDPKIPKEVVADTKAEWFCSDCDRILHGKKKVKPPSKPAMQSVQIPAPPQAQPLPPASSPQAIKPLAPRYGLPYIPGMALSPAQKKQYLDSLSKEKLIEIVLRAADLAPNMPIFETPLHEVPQSSLFPPRSQFPFATLPKSMRPPIPPGSLPPPPPPQIPQHARQIQHPVHQPQPTSSNAPVPVPIPAQTSIPVYSHPTAGTPSKPNTVAPTAVTADDDEGYYDDFDELALVYPKPGEGVYDLVLPPESTDLGVLLEGPDCRTFSHWVRGRGAMGTKVGG